MEEILKRIEFCMAIYYLFTGDKIFLFFCESEHYFGTLHWCVFGSTSSIYYLLSLFEKCDPKTMKEKKKGEDRIWVDEWNF